MFFVVFLSASYKRGQTKPVSVRFHPASPPRSARQQPGDDIRLAVVVGVGSRIIAVIGSASF